MTSTVAALYDSRAEAETAYARLSAEANASNLRILTRQTVAALSTLQISKEDAETYRDGLNGGAVLLVGEIAAGEDPNRIVDILQGSRRSPPRAGAGQFGAPLVAGGGDLSGTVAAPQEVRIPVVEEELRVDKREVLGGGARVRTLAREERVEQPVTLREERLEATTRPSGRQLTVEEVRSAGLLKDRVIQVSEMREEPVITKEAFVREEVVLSKTVSERTETIRETLRRTEVDIEDVPGSRQAPERNR
jgi:stress response protein YsnF